MIIKNAAPFFFPGDSTGCLLIHGFSSSPTEMHPLGVYLSQKGHTVLGVRLAHGRRSSLRRLRRGGMHQHGDRVRVALPTGNPGHRENLRAAGRLYPATRQASARHATKQQLVANAGHYRGADARAVRMGNGGSLNAHPRGWLPDPYLSRGGGRTRLEAPGTEAESARSRLRHR